MTFKRHVHIYKVQAMKEAEIEFEDDEDFSKKLKQIIDDKNISYKKPDRQNVSVWWDTEEV